MIELFGSTSKKRNVYFGKYHPGMDKAIANFKDARTVKVFKGYVFIHKNSFGYFTELITAPYRVITTLVLNK